MALRVPLRRLRALILHRTPVREKDRIVEAYTREEGRLRFFAPGVRHVASRRAGHLEPLVESCLVVARSARGDTIREARAVRSFPRLRADIARLRFAYAVAGLLRNGTGEGQRDVLLYDAILSLLAAADTAGTLPPFLLEAAHLHVLRSLGALPDLRRCTHCRLPLRSGAFSLRGTRRGFWCAACGGGGDGEITDVVKLMRYLTRTPRPRAGVRARPLTQRRLRAVIRALWHSQPLPVPAGEGLRGRTV